MNIPWYYICITKSRCYDKYAVCSTPRPRSSSPPSKNSIVIYVLVMVSWAECCIIHHTRCSSSKPVAQLTSATNLMFMAFSQRLWKYNIHQTKRQISGPNLGSVQGNNWTSRVKWQTWLATWTINLLTLVAYQTRTKGNHLCKNLE